MVLNMSVGSLPSSFLRSIGNCVSEYRVTALPRRLRRCPADVPAPVVQRCNNRDVRFFMRTTIVATGSVWSMRVPFGAINSMYQRTGTPWESRCRTGVLNPTDNRRSSLGAHVNGEPDPLVCDHPIFYVPKSEAEARVAAYLKLFRIELDSGVIHENRESANFPASLGNNSFRARLERAQVSPSVCWKRSAREASIGMIFRCCRPLVGFFWDSAAGRQWPARTARRRAAGAGPAGGRRRHQRPCCGQ